MTFLTCLSLLCNACMHAVLSATESTEFSLNSVFNIVIDPYLMLLHPDSIVAFLIQDQENFRMATGQSGALLVGESLPASGTTAHLHMGNDNATATVLPVATHTHTADRVSMAPKVWCLCLKLLTLHNPCLSLRPPENLLTIYSNDSSTTVRSLGKHWTHARHITPAK